VEIEEPGTLWKQCRLELGLNQFEYSSLFAGQINSKMRDSTGGVRRLIELSNNVWQSK